MAVYRRMRGNPRADIDLDRAHHGIVRPRLGDEHDVASVAHDQMTRETGLVAQPLDHRRADIGQRERTQIVEAELHHARAEPVVAVAIRAFEVPERMQRLHETQRGRTRQAEALRDHVGRQHRLARIE